MRMMAAFEKGEKLRFIGHLDLMRTMQRALRRSHLPIKYSNGFNPHIRLSFAAPLSVGVAGKREMMEVPVEDGTSPAEFIQKLNACLPPDLQIVSAKPVSDEFPTLMSLMAGSEYSVRLPRSAAADQAAARFADFMALKEYIAVRRTKSGDADCNIRPFVLDGGIENSETEHVIHLTIVSDPKDGALKPSLWLRCLYEFAGQEPQETEKAMIFREEMLARNKEGKLVPMEELA